MNFYHYNHRVFLFFGCIRYVSTIIMTIDCFSGKVAEFDSPLRLLEDKSSMFMKLVSEYSSRSSSIPDA